MEAIAETMNNILSPDLAAQTSPANSRTDEDYVIAALKKGLAVMEALKGQTYEPVSVREVAKRTKFDYDFCRRALKTLKVAGWAIEDDNGWRLSVKAMQFSDKFLDFAIAVTNSTPVDSQKPI